MSSQQIKNLFEKKNFKLIHEFIFIGMIFELMILILNSIAFLVTVLLFVFQEELTSINNRIDLGTTAGG